jgi:hypothetical protein
MPPPAPSTKPVAERLQVKPGRSLAVIGAPAHNDQAIGALDQRSSAEQADVVLIFVSNRAALDAHLAATLPTLKPSAILWIAYPKLTSAMAGDLHRDVIHNLVPGHGLDVVSAIAIDADWSALRLKRL